MVMRMGGEYIGAILLACKGILVYYGAVMGGE